VKSDFFVMVKILRSFLLCEFRIKTRVNKELLIAQLLFILLGSFWFNLMTQSC